jgi:hypothetical protein
MIAKLFIDKSKVILGCFKYELDITDIFLSSLEDVFGIHGVEYLEIDSNIYSKKEFIEMAQDIGI